MTEDPKTAVQRQWESHIAVNDGDWADQKAREILKGREYYDGEIGESDLAAYLRSAFKSGMQAGQRQNWKVHAKELSKVKAQVARHRKRAEDAENELAVAGPPGIKHGRYEG